MNKVIKNKPVKFLYKLYTFSARTFSRKQKSDIYWTLHNKRGTKKGRPHKRGQAYADAAVKGGEGGQAKIFEKSEPIFFGS